MTVFEALIAFIAVGLWSAGLVSAVDRRRKPQVLKVKGRRFSG